MSEFYVILTNTGKAKITNAHATKTPVDLTEMSVGDGNGSYYEPTENQTELVNEVHRGGINEISIDEANLNWLICNFVITADVGGFTVREVGLFDADGDLIAIGKYPESYKPELASGSAKDLMIKMIIEVTNTGDVILNIDPAIILATREFVTISIDENNRNYYTKTQVDVSLNEKSDNGHGHTLNDIEETETDKKLTSAERTKLAGITEGATNLTLGEGLSNAYRGDRGAHAYNHSKVAHLTLGEGAGNAHRGDKGTVAYNHSIKEHAPSNANYLPLGTAPSQAYRGDRGKIAYDHSKKAHAPSNANYLPLGSASSQAYRGDRGTVAYNHSKAAHAPSNANYLPLGSSSSKAYRGDRGTIAYNHAVDASKHFNLKVNIRVFSASTTYAKPSNLAFIIVEIVGAGGGAGGCPKSSMSTSASASSGGGGGQYAKKVFLASELSSSTSVVIGAGGSGGAAAIGSSGDGLNGGDSLFGSVLNCDGGDGGNGGYDAQAHQNNWWATAPALGGSGSSGGDFSQNGGYSTNAIAFYGEVVQGSIGGDSYFSRTIPANGLGMYQSPSKGYRGGGAPGETNNSSTGAGKTGGIGGNGYCVITEYLNV